MAVPFKWYPPSAVVTQSLVWRLLDLDEVQGRPVDLVIATKFPSYVVRHPNKVVWLVHQFRQAYDLDRTELGEYGEEPFDRAARRAVHRLDRTTLSEAQSAVRDLGERRVEAREVGRARSRGAAAAARSRSSTAATSTATSSSQWGGSTVRSASTSCSRPRPRTAICAS